MNDDVAPAALIVKDPVCGMDVDPQQTAHRHEHAGETHYFCSAGCVAKFRADPKLYLEGGKEPPKPTRTDVEYTCPMHPEIVQIGPGACPICAMALEPVMPIADTGPNPELLDMTRRFWIGAALTIPVLFLAMGELIPGLDIDAIVSPDISVWVQLALATPVVVWAGQPFFERGWDSLITRNLNMFTLIALGTGTAWLYSVVATIAPGAFPAAFRDGHGIVAVYFEAAAVITVLVLLGQVLELRAREQTGSALRSLLDLAPKMARIFQVLVARIFQVLVHRRRRSSQHDAASSALAFGPHCVGKRTSSAGAGPFRTTTISFALPPGCCRCCRCGRCGSSPDVDVDVVGAVDAGAALRGRVGADRADRKCYC